MTEDTRQQQDGEQAPAADPGQPAQPRQGAVGRFFNSVMTKVIIVVVVVLVGAYALLAKVEGLNPFGSHTTINTTVVLGKLTKIEQVHVATRSYPVDVQITQSVGVIPCFLICNQMDLKGSGTDDAIVDLTKLTQQEVSVDQSTKTVTVRMPAPTIGPAELNAAACTITSSHGAVNSVTQAFRNNPNGYRPLYTAAQTQIRNTAQQDPELITAGEQSTRTLLTRLLGDVGVKKVTVVFTGSGGGF